MFLRIRRIRKNLDDLRLQLASPVHNLRIIFCKKFVNQNNNNNCICCETYK